MSTPSSFLRERASADRMAAGEATLPLVKARLAQSAERFDEMADRQEALESSHNYAKNREQNRKRHQLPR